MKEPIDGVFEWWSVGVRSVDALTKPLLPPSITASLHNPLS